MTRLPFFLLAGAALPAALSAQTVSPPVPWEDTPQVRLNVPAAPETRAPASVPTPPPRPAAVQTPPAVAPAPRPVAAVPQPLPPAARPAPQVAAAPLRPVPQPLPQAARPAPAAAPAIRTAAVPGQRIDARWRDPRFGVANYGAYGLYPPATGSRWIRYHDDALLVDQGDIVRDARSGLDWDEYGDWSEEDGVPVYVGRGDYEPGEADYAYVEGHADGAERAYANNERYGHRGRGYREERVYYGDAPPLRPEDFPPGTVITETIVKRPPPVVKTHVYHVEQPVVVRTKAQRLYRHRVKPAPARVPYGEKG